MHPELQTTPPRSPHIENLEENSTTSVNQLLNHFCPWISLFMYIKLNPQLCSIFILRCILKFLYLTRISQKKTHFAITIPVFTELHEYIFQED